MSKTTVLYKDIAPGAAEDAAVSTSAASTFSVPARLPEGVTPEPIISGELNHWGLTGEFVSLDSQSQKLAFWSTGQSNSNCQFSSPPVITIRFSQLYSSVGVTLVFDRAAGDYCTSVNIKWFQGDTLKVDKLFAPDSPSYFCEQTVTSYDKIEIALKGTSLPYRYAKLEQILFGVYRYFGMTELRRASIVNEMNLIAAELPVSTMKWTLDSREDVDYMFQLKQPTEVWNDDHLIGVYYVDGYRRTAKSVYDIDCYDAFGVLGESPFTGGVYSGYSARQLLRDIVGADFELVFETVDTNLSGIIQPCTRREAMQQVLFAWGACASTDGRESIRVFVPGGTAVEIGQDRVYTGVTVETAAIVTEVRVTAHEYVESSDGNVEFGGVKYQDNQTVFAVTNPNVTASDKQNVVEITDATLVSPVIGQAVAQRVYDDYARRSTNKAKLIWRGERLGDCITVPNAWGGTNTGEIARMEIALSNTVAASCETIGV